VLFRVFVGKGDPGSHAMKKHLWDVSWTVLPRAQVFDFNQALMDFGATACMARGPLCGSCPMSSRCAAYPFEPARQQRLEPERRRSPSRSRAARKPNRAS
jgi:A/G-specific adenine glycosylase